MNLDLGILWIEDSFSAEEEASLKRRVADAGFVARIQVISNGGEIEELARLHSLYHRFDLILLDYRLKNENGDELATSVRRLFPSVTILFYSGSVEEAELRRMIAAKEVEGVYCSHRSRFIERTGTLIDQTARALDRLSGMRGLAMKVVAECDDLMKNAVLGMTRREPKCAEKVAEMDNDVFSFMTEMKVKYEAARPAGMQERIDTRAIDSTKLFKHFRRLTQVAAANPAAFGLDGDQVDRLRELRKLSAQYDKVVLNKRNILGHVTEVEGAEGWVLQGSDEISVNDFAEIRRGFAAHIDAIREMSDLVLLLDRK
ncbi:response regulator [Agrobacterium vitis]|uniref:Response regulator n=1 Tax=Agrobacterium vitis TaxID=373 RepID=A0AAE5ATZ6_AGRVI|nr:response regulator [Agrobacterium vitis]MCF1497819.1 response regulator [Allorhizobium sp. Av2]MCM2438715.1 response regulator [Agrobacterium vitis]MUZ55959.1 response regulator [Agrobacterium vitis]